MKPESSPVVPALPPGVLTRILPRTKRFGPDSPLTAIPRPPGSGSSTLSVPWTALEPYSAVPGPRITSIAVACSEGSSNSSLTLQKPVGRIGDAVLQDQEAAAGAGAGEHRRADRGEVLLAAAAGEPHAGDLRADLVDVRGVEQVDAVGVDAGGVAGELEGGRGIARGGDDDLVRQVARGGLRHGRCAEQRPARAAGRRGALALERLEPDAGRVADSAESVAAGHVPERLVALLAGDEPVLLLPVVAQHAAAAGRWGASSRESRSAARRARAPGCGDCAGC